MWANCKNKYCKYRKVIVTIAWLLAFISIPAGDYVSTIIGKSAINPLRGILFLSAIFFLHVKCRRTEAGSGFSKRDEDDGWDIDMDGDLDID